MKQLEEYLGAFSLTVNDDAMKEVASNPHAGLLPGVDRLAPASRS